MTISLQRSNPVMYFILLALALIVLLSVSRHAIDKHGSVAETIYAQCQQNSLGSYRRMRDGRIANICQIDDNIFAVRIDKDGRNVSDFIIDNARTLQEAIEYVQSTGYTRWIGTGVFR